MSNSLFWRWQTTGKTNNPLNSLFFETPCSFYHNFNEQFHFAISERSMLAKPEILKRIWEFFLVSLDAWETPWPQILYFPLLWSGIARYCEVLRGIVRYCLVRGIARPQILGFAQVCWASAVWGIAWPAGRITGPLDPRLGFHLPRTHPGKTGIRLRSPRQPWGNPWHLRHKSVESGWFGSNQEKINFQRINNRVDTEQQQKSDFVTVRLRNIQIRVFWRF